MWTKIPSKKEKGNWSKMGTQGKKRMQKEKQLTYKARSVVKDYKSHQDIHYVNKKSLIPLSKNPNFHDWNKHINMRYHFIREYIMKKEVQLKFVISHDQIVDILSSILILKILKGWRWYTNQI